MNTKAIVDVQGFKTDDNQFILKEIALVCNDQIEVFSVKPPYPFRNLSSTERKQVNWIQRNRNMYWNDGMIPYNSYVNFIDNFLKNKTIYCKGLEKVNWIRNILQRDNVINLEDMGCPKLLSLYEEYRSSNDTYHCIYHPTICALKNVTCLRKWCINNKLL